MFVEAIKNVGDYTRSVLFISRKYNSQEIKPGSATLFFVNDEGVAVTCKHVALSLLSSEKINKKYEEYKAELNRLAEDSHYRNNKRKLAEKYNYNDNTVIEQKINFINCVDKLSSFDCILHPDYDLAIIKFKGYDNILYKGHAVFADKDYAEPGEMLCRLGYPFPEFKGYSYDETYQKIKFDPSRGTLNTPRFPLEGMVTRMLASKENKIMGYEISTPGLRGQSGGPLFNKEGIVMGMQHRTKHLYLGFDIIDEEATVNSKIKGIHNQPFLHVGECIHAAVIKEFLDEHNIKYYTV